MKAIISFQVNFGFFMSLGKNGISLDLRKHRKSPEDPCLCLGR
jgi:hypothetical protein